MAEYYKSIIIEKYPCLSQLDLSLKDSIKLFYIFGVNGTEVLFVTLDDGVYAFGTNQNKCLGLGFISKVKQPTKLAELCDKRVIKFGSGSNNNVLALTANGSVYAWGHNNCGQLGFGNTMNSNKPQIIKGLSGVLDIACGGYHSLALTMSGEVYAFGSNSYGQIGNGCIDNQLSPIKISAFGTEKVITIACGFEHSLVCTESGHVFGWGSNEFGQLTNTRGEDNQCVPKLIATGLPFINKIQCGRYISWLLSSNCRLFCVGSSGENRLEVGEKFLDIGTSIHSNISVGISEKQECVVWDENGCLVSSEPLVDDILSVEYAIAAYTGLKHTINTVCLAENNELLAVYDRFISDHNLGKYNIQYNQLCVFRVGEFGKIAKSFNRDYSKILAIKKRKVAVTVSKGSSKRNNREIEILRQLNCDNIISYYGHWHEKISVDLIYCFIELEYCPKRLHDVISEIYSNEMHRESRDYDFVLSFSLLVASELFAEILDGLSYLHSHTPPILHRNLTDKNVLITDSKNGKMLKICGFRNATLHEYEDQPHSISVGTVGVMAPEVAIGSHYNIKADIYSLGTVMQKLFDIDINDINSTSYKNISSISLFNSYNTKFMYARKLLVRLLSPQAKRRPNCQQILRDRDSWALTYGDIKHEYNYDFLLLKTEEKSFFRFFAETKLAPVFDRKKSKYLSDEFSASIRKVLGKEKKVKFDTKFTDNDKNLSILKLTKNGNYVKNFNEIEFIGSGGFGAVFKVSAKSDEKIYAIKKVPLSDKISDIQEAAKELSFLSQLKGDYTVNSIDFWLEENYYLNTETSLPFNSELQSGNTKLFYPFCPKLLHIQMELCYQTLRTVLKELQQEFFNPKAHTLTPIGYYISSELFTEILQCVDYIHKQKPSIIHRDLKPDNILLVHNTSNGRFVKLADFGLATIHAFDGKSHTEFRGTVKYMAPEVVNSRAYDTKADIFSLGIIAQQLNIQRTINPLLNQKYECMYALVNKLLSPKTSDRLDCDQMLSEKHAWSMSMDELKVRSNVEKITTNIQSTESSHKSFCKYYLKSKLEI